MTYAAEAVPRGLLDRYEVFRVVDRVTGLGVAICFSRGDAELIVGALNAHARPIVPPPDAPAAPVFVFGSNEAGIHGAGAALFAKQNRGAIQGRGAGHHGNSYAIPTKGRDIKTLPLERIAAHVKIFLDYAAARPDLSFEVTKIGCGLAGYKPIDIAPLFQGAPDNCELPDGWRLTSGLG